MSETIKVTISNDGCVETPPKKMIARTTIQQDFIMNTISNTLVGTNKFLQEITETLKHNKYNNDTNQHTIHPNKPLRNSIKNGEITPIKILHEQKEHTIMTSYNSDENNTLSSLYLKDVDYSILDEKEEENEINYSASKDEDAIKRNIDYINNKNINTDNKPIRNFSSSKKYANYNETKLKEALQQSVEIPSDDFNKDIDDSVVFISDEDKVDVEVVENTFGVLNFAVSDEDLPKSFESTNTDVNTADHPEINIQNTCDVKENNFSDNINYLFNDDTKKEES